MKTIISTITFLILALPAFCQEGTNFESLTFREALVKAKSENKLVFMDCYTSWCGPCQFMATTIFPKKEVGDFFNTHFINVKYDMEKGEGPELQGKYKIQAYPTFLVIRPDGTVQHRIVGGFQEADFFISLVKQGINLKTSQAYLEEKYKKNTINKAELTEYQLALRYSGENQRFQEVTQKLQPILTTEDRLRKEYWPIIEIATFESEDFKFFASHADEYKKIIDPQKVDYQLRMIYQVAIAQTIRSGAKDPLNRLKEVEEELKTISLEGKEKLHQEIELNRAILSGDKEKIITLAEKCTTSRDTKIWNIMNAINIVKDKLTDKDLERILALESKFLSTDPQSHDFYKEYFENFKALASRKVYYYNLNYKEALKRAVMQDKQIFLVLARNNADRVKTEKELNRENIRKYLNSNFICLNIDSASEEGISLSKQFGVTSFPTFIMINRDGTLNRKITETAGCDFLTEQIISDTAH